MRACILPRFGGPEVLRVAELPPPVPRSREVLVAVSATAVNLIDCGRREGYGAPLFRLRGARDFPMVLGTDFCGTALAVGRGVRHIRPGDTVWGAKGHGRWGTYAEQVAVPANEIGLSPRSVSAVKAVAIPYAGLTAWKALTAAMKLDERTSRGKRVLVHAGAGGVGSVAIQLLKHWGATVYTTCGPANVATCRRLGADEVIDHTREDIRDRLSGLDGVLNTVGEAVEAASLAVLALGRGAVYATLLHPTLDLVGRHGVPGGLVRALWQQHRARAREAKHGRRYAWVLHSADPTGLEALRQAVDRGAVRPLVGQVFEGLEAIPAAHVQCESRHGSGKLVVRLSEN